MLYYGTRKVIIRFVNDLLSSTAVVLSSVLVTRLKESEDFCISISTQSEAEVKELVERSFYSNKLTTTRD